MPRRGDEAVDAFLLSLSHGPLAIVLPILWLLSLPASIFRVQAALQIPFGCEFLGAGFDFGDPVAFDGSRFSRALSFPMQW
jgi:hypothetical protein